MRPDVIELLTLYEGPNPSEAFKFNPVKNPPRPRDHRDNPWITEDPANGRWLVFRSQVPDRLEPAYDIALAAGLLEQHVLSPESQLQLYQNAGLPVPEQNQRWPIFPTNVDALVIITDQGRAALAEHRSSDVAPVVVQPQTSPPKIVVDVDRGTVQWKGKTYKVGSKQALRWLNVLINADGRAVSSTDLEKHDKELINPKVVRLRKYLERDAPPVAKLIVSASGNAGGAYIDRKHLR